MAEVTNHQDLLDSVIRSPHTISLSLDYRAEVLKLEDEIDQALHELRKSQASEYKIAEERLYAQKGYLHNLYQQLERERSEWTHCKSINKKDVLLDAVLNRVDQIKQEVAKLKDMEQVAKGFGRTSKGILREHFGLEIEE